MLAQFFFYLLFFYFVVILFRLFSLYITTSSMSVFTCIILLAVQRYTSVA